MIVGKYKIEKKIGEGSFGVVYQCMIPGTDIKVAIKIVDLKIAQSKYKMEITDVMKEIELLKQINSP